MAKRKYDRKAAVIKAQDSHCVFRANFAVKISICWDNFTLL